jgi:hypothetical protein
MEKGLIALCKSCKGVGAKEIKQTARRNCIKKYREEFYTVHHFCEGLMAAEKLRWKCPNDSLRQIVKCEEYSNAMDDDFVYSENPYGSAESGYQRFVVGSGGVFLAIDQRFVKLSLLKPGWAMTVNYSQGKEYETSDLVLPKKDQSGRNLVHSTFALFDRSHVHVAMTRPKKKFTLLGDPTDMQEIATRNNESLTPRFTFLRYWIAHMEEGRSRLSFK